jgi:Flp pilus assembly pilin Flp
MRQRPDPHGLRRKRSQARLFLACGDGTVALEYALIAAAVALTISTSADAVCDALREIFTSILTGARAINAF